MIAQIVRFKSKLSDEEIRQRYDLRAPQYRMVEGLAQKYYVRFVATGEHGGIYLWDSGDALRRFRASDLARSLPDVYLVRGVPDIQSADVVMALYPDLKFAPHH